MLRQAFSYTPRRAVGRCRRRRRQPRMMRKESPGPKAARKVASTPPTAKPHCARRPARRPTNRTPARRTFFAADSVCNRVHYACAPPPNIFIKCESQPRGRRGVYTVRPCITPTAGTSDLTRHGGNPAGLTPESSSLILTFELRGSYEYASAFHFCDREETKRISVLSRHSS
jgi:hypothetical protein